MRSRHFKSIPNTRTSSLPHPLPLPLPTNPTPMSTSPLPPPLPFHQTNTDPDPYISFLQTCTSMREFKQIHSHAIRSGAARHPLHHRRLLSMPYARLLLDQAPLPDPSLYDSMITAYSAHNSPAPAVQMYIEMLTKGFPPNTHTFPSLLKSFTRDTFVECGDQLHAHIIKFGFASNPFVRSALIHAYSRSGEADAARQLFDESPQRDVVVWNAMISGYNRCKMFDESCKMFREMERKNMRPTQATLVSVLSACAKLKDLDCGVRVRSLIETGGIDVSLKLENASVDMYASCGDMSAAWRVFEKMEVKDVISWTAIVSGFVNSGQIDRARALFDQMPDRDVIAWTSMIAGYIQMSRFKEALEIFRQMQVSNVRPDEFTMVSVLMACAQLGALGTGEWIRAYMERNKIKADTTVGNALIDMYSKCGSMDNAAGIFQKMHKRDKFTWTAMIVGYAVNGHGEDALDLFEEMLRASVRPDEITFIGVLSACTHTGLVSKGRGFFSSMITNHGIMPTVAHYGCLVDLLGRAGLLKEALETITNMPMKPNSTVWGSLLAACRVHKNVDMAKLAAMNLVELEPENSAAYIVLSNLYAKCNEWEEVKKVRRVIMEKGLRKMPGCSLIEMDGIVHEFVAGDRYHPRCDQIYSKLEEIIRKIGLAGYVPDTTEVLLDVREEEKENVIYQHSEKLAIAFGLISSGPSVVIRVAKNLRICIDCHNAIKLVTRVYRRDVIVRDRTCFHHFCKGVCSCKDYW